MKEKDKLDNNISTILGFDINTLPDPLSDKSKIIKMLKDDAHYFGDLGKEDLSKSDVRALLGNLLDFKKDKDPTVPMLQGSYFHTSCLETEKLANFEIVECSSRNTNIYKEIGELRLLQKEADMVNDMVTSLKANLELSDLVWGRDGENEVPGIKEIMGNMWKAKADRVLDDCVIDLKTTADLDGFRYSARKYDYDCQAWIYNQIFGKPMVFVVVEKNTNRLGLFECSDDFLEYGKQKVVRATEVYEKFFGPNATEDVEQYFKSDIL